MIEWREVPSYPNYMVSNHGEIARKTLSKGARKLNPTINKDGYGYCTLIRNFQKKTFRVHRLVALALGESALHIDHINGQRNDNRVENLRYMSKTEHAKLHYGKNISKPEVAASLTELQVIELRDKYANGMATKELMAEYKLSHAAVCNIGNGKTYRNVGGKRTNRLKGWKGGNCGFL